MKIQDEPQYEVVLKMVLWDEEKDLIMRRLKVNGVDERRAKEIYATARRERLQLIRTGGFKQMLKGLLVGIAFTGAYYLMNSEVLGIQPFVASMLGYFCAVGWALAIYLLVRGLSRVLLAPSTQGSVAEL